LRIIPPSENLEISLFSIQRTADYLYIEKVVPYFLDRLEVNLTKYGVTIPAIERTLVIQAGRPIFIVRPLLLEFFDILDMPQVNPDLNTKNPGCWKQLYG
jgi:hypothetical protein